MCLSIKRQTQSLQQLISILLSNGVSHHSPQTFNSPLKKNQPTKIRIQINNSLLQQIAENSQIQDFIE